MHSSPSSFTLILFPELSEADQRRDYQLDESIQSLLQERRSLILDLCVENKFKLDERTPSFFMN